MLHDILLGCFRSNNLDKSTKKSLHTFLLLLVLIRQDGHVEALRQSINNGRQQLQQHVLDIRCRVLDEHTDCLKGTYTQVGFRGIRTINDLKESLEQLWHVCGESIGSGSFGGVVI